MGWLKGRMGVAEDEREIKGLLMYRRSTTGDGWTGEPMDRTSDHRFPPPGHLSHHTCAGKLIYTCLPINFTPSSNLIRINHY